MVMRFSGKMVAVRWAGSDTTADAITDDASTILPLAWTEPLQCIATTWLDLAPYRRMLISWQVGWPSSACVRCRLHRRHRHRRRQDHLPLAWTEPFGVILIYS